MKNLVGILFVIINFLFIASSFGQVDSSYYPLKVGNYWEYATARPFYGLYSLFRQGIFDTIRIDNHLWYQQYSFWGVNDNIDLLHIDESGHVLTYNDTGIPDTLIILSPDYMSEEERQWLVSRFGGDEVHGYLSPNYETIPILPLGLTESQCIQANYNYSGMFFWATQYAPNIGKVRVMAEGAESLLHSMRLSDSVYNIPISLEIDQLDTIQFDINSDELSCINNSALEFNFSFDPSAFEWNSYSLYSIEFYVNPELSTYELDFDASVGDEDFHFSLDSYALSDTGYWDVLSMYALPSLQAKYGPISISGELSETHLDSLIRRSNYSSSKYVRVDGVEKACEMGCDSFQVRLVFYNVTVEVDSKPIVPGSLVVEPAYPNPFNPGTTLSYGLPNDSQVSLIIYDLKGNVVQNLESGFRSAGWHDVVWSGERKDGKAIDTGVYLARLVADESSQVIKMLYLK